MIRKGEYQLDLTGPSAEVVGVGFCVLAAVVSGLAVAFLGFYALLLPVYLGLACVAIWKPFNCAVAALMLGIAFEPGATDLSRPISVALYQMPPGFENALPVTMTPLEFLVCMIGLGVVLHESSGRRVAQLPAVVFALPAFIGLSFAYGSSLGGDLSTGYQEARGLLFGIVAFVVARRMVSEGAGQGIVKAVLLSTVGLGIIVLYRYFFVIGGSSAAAEVSYAHEDAMFLAGGVILGAVLSLYYTGLRTRIWLLGYEALLLAALFATSRRAGTLALLVGAVSLAVCTIRRHPKAMVLVGTPLLLVSVAYMATYWNKEYGATAQPARAVRSQIDPNSRDDSSDAYRRTEKFDVETTIRLNRVMGVGLGRPFVTFRPLPSLKAFWPLQEFTPHTNILWLWLKFGVLGASAFIATWVLALTRSMLALREARGPTPYVATVTICLLLMYFAYAQIDLALIGSRSACLLAVVIAVGLSLAPAQDSAP